MIEFKKDNGELFEAELISYFELVNTGKKYVFYTSHEQVENGLIKMYVSEVNTEGQTISADMTNEEWTNIKTIMKSMLKGIKDDNIKYLSWEVK